MNALAHRLPAERTAGDRPPAGELDRALLNASPADVIAAALATVGREHLALVSSFGTESAALLKVMADVDPAIPVVFLDTGWLFEETLAYRDTLIAALGLRDVRSIKPLEEALNREDPDRELWFSDPDACCRIRKVEPMWRALADFDVWIAALRRDQSDTRRSVEQVEHHEIDGRSTLKVMPLAEWTLGDVTAYLRAHDVPQHPLAERGYTSIGCWPCTRPTAAGEGERAGRWSGTRKTECGLHAPSGRSRA